MKKIINACLNVICKAVASVSLFLVSMATGTISILTMYEPEMPVALKTKDEE